MKYHPLIPRTLGLLALALLTQANALTEEIKTYPVPDFKQATLYVTARDAGDHLKESVTLAFQKLVQPDEGMLCVILNPAHRFQTMVGFGGALTDASAETFAKLPPDKQQEVLTAYFSPDKGIGYTFGRTHINSCDFSSDSYAYADVPGDTSLSHFSIAHDLKYRIPFIKAAMAMAGGNSSYSPRPGALPRG